MSWRDFFRTFQSRRAQLGQAGITGPLPAQLRPKRASDVRSLILLFEHLAPEQRAELQSGGYFSVRGADSGKLYRIRADRTLNVDEHGSDGHYVRSWCFAPAGQLPIGDVLLAQKFAIEVFENEALAIANPGRPPFTRYQFSTAARYW